MARGKADRVSELRKLVRFARQNGLTALKSGDIEFHIDARFIKPKQTKLKGSDLSNLPGNIPTDFTLWSAPDLPEASER